MKSKLFQIIALIFLIANFSNGQYIPFVEEGKFWIYKSHENPDLPAPIFGHAITFKGDTIINL